MHKRIHTIFFVLTLFSFLASFETLLTTNSHITNSQIDEFLEWYLASGASLPKGNEMLSSIYLAPPQSLSKRFKWTRHAVRGKSAATAASGGRKTPRCAPCLCFLAVVLLMLT